VREQGRAGGELMAGTLLAAEGISKSFPGVKALTDVSFDVRAGEAHVLLGENGAGKSTLIKAFAGVHLPDAGVIRLDGRPVVLSTPRAATDAGIVTVFQELNLVPGLTVAENVFLGRELRTAGFTRRRAMQRRTAELAGEIGIALDPATPGSRLGVAQAQMTVILRALAAEQLKVLIMDEPTAVLSRHEIAQLFAVVHRLKSRGIGIVYISHRLEEIAQIGDRVTVLRDGRWVRTDPVGSVDTETLVESMVGRPVNQVFPPRNAAVGEVALSLDGLTAAPRVRRVSLDVRRGEVLGLFGLVGAGRTETLRALCGADPLDAGRVVVGGKVARVASPRHAMGLGIGLAPEDRRNQGIVPDMSVAENIALSSVKQLRSNRFLRPRRIAALGEEYQRSMRIATATLHSRIATLSGGNQQKCVLARLIAANCDVLLLDEPTRGIDVGARSEIYGLINRLVERGKAVIVASSDLHEVMGISDRVLVFRRGVVSAEFDRASISEQAIMRAAVPDRLEEDMLPDGEKQVA
jgi:ribose transport system ATP-binding protein